MITKTYTELDQDLIEDWQELWEGTTNRNPFNSPGWSRAYIEAYKPTDIKIIAFYEEKNLVGIVPLIKERYLGINAYAYIGNKFAHLTCILGDFENESFLKALEQEIEKLKIVKIDHLNELEYGLLEDKGKGVLTLNLVNVLFMYLEMQDNKLVLRKRSQILKKARKELEGLHLQEEKDQEKGLNMVFEVDMKSLKYYRKYNVFADMENREFYIKLTEYLGDNLKIHIMYHNNKPVSYEIGFIEGKTYMDVERAYLMNHEYYTPGKVTMVLLAELLAKKGFEILNLGPGTDNFKRSLAKNSKVMRDVIVVKNPFVRNYFIYGARTREAVYKFVFGKPRVYTFYKGLKILLSK